MYKLGLGLVVSHDSMSLDYMAIPPTCEVLRAGSCVEHLITFWKFKSSRTCVTSKQPMLIGESYYYSNSVLSVYLIYIYLLSASIFLHLWLI